MMNGRTSMMYLTASMKTLLELSWTRIGRIARDWTQTRSCGGTERGSSCSTSSTSIRRHSYEGDPYPDRTGLHRSAGVGERPYQYRKFDKDAGVGIGL